MGVSASGASDPISLRIGNRLVGNPEGAAALEMTLVGGAFTFERTAVLAVSGADFGPALEGISLPMWTSIEAQAGQTLALGPSLSGARAYLCIQGGISVEPFLGSASTHVLSGLGGSEGRALRTKGDRLKLGGSQFPFSKKGRYRGRHSNFLQHSQDSPSHECAAKQLVCGFLVGSVLRKARFASASNPNRMGIRLEGPRIPPQYGPRNDYRGRPSRSARFR